MCIRDSATPVAENLFEVVLTVTVTAKLGERTAYPVSYTHLDVYKRHPLRASSRPLSDRSTSTQPVNRFSMFHWL